MQLTISKKLILSFLGLTILVLIATLGLARWSFKHGFLDYVNELEVIRLENISNDLKQEYIIANNSWESLTPRRFDYWLDKHRPKGPPPKQGEFSQLPPPDKMPTRPKRRGSKPDERFRPPIGLFDSEGLQVFGPSMTSIDNLIVVPIVIDGLSVGELRGLPRHEFETIQETSFSRQQLNTSALIAVFSLLLAFFTAWVLTRVLMSPVKKMIVGVSRLSDGDYSPQLIKNQEQGKTSGRQDELGKLMKDLDQLAKKLEQNRSSRRRWLADISHELRTPVTVLTGEIEILKDGIRPFDREQLLSLDQEVSRLRHLIDDLYELSVSDMGGLRYSLTPLNVREPLDSLVTLNQRRTKEQDIDLQISGETTAMVNADVQRLEQLFTNLLENSLAYTDAPGKLSISLSCTKNEVSIKFQDTLPGVSQDDCQQLFDPLYRQEKSRSRRTAGAGLGLAICKNIVDAHQGSMSASPSSLGGLCIEIIFPTWRNN